LIEHRIFMNDDLRKKFGAVDESLSTALKGYSIGKDAKDRGLERSGQQKVSRLDEMVNEVERAIQKRLRCDEA